MGFALTAKEGTFRMVPGVVHSAVENVGAYRSMGATLRIAGSGFGFASFGADAYGAISNYHSGDTVRAGVDASTATLGLASIGVGTMGFALAPLWLDLKLFIPNVRNEMATACETAGGAWSPMGPM